jgi:hypothetical protein
MHLGIAVVYLLRESDGPLLQLHLDQLQKCTEVPYTIYGSVNRLIPKFREVLEHRDEVVICEPDTTSEFGSWEHSYYLTHLVNRALADGATHIVSLHVDSFPICEGWVAALQRRLEGGNALAAVVAREEGETIRPWTSCLFVPRTFYNEHGPIVSLRELSDGTPDYRTYLAEAGGSIDAGDAYGYILHTRKLPWHQMLRSNVVNDHYFIGGIYDGLVFHLGGAVTQATSYISPPGMRAVRPIQSLIPECLKRPLRGWLQERRQAASVSAFDHIRERLLGDPEGYFAYLRGM